MTYANGEKHEGYWDQGSHQDGKFTFTYCADETVFKGIAKNGKKYHGVETYKHGGRYEGYFGGDEFHGTGFFKWPGGRTYNGDWTYGKMDGQGECIYEDGAIYKGQWKNGMKHGNGVMTWPDGRVYDGEWVSDKQHGMAMLKSTLGHSVIAEYESGSKVRYC